MKKVTYILTAIAFMLLSFTNANAQKVVNDDFKGFSVFCHNDAINLGFMNPDGARVLGESEAVIFEIAGNRKYKLVASGHISTEFNNVYLTNNKWSFKQLPSGSWTLIQSNTGYTALGDFINTPVDFLDVSDPRIMFKFQPGILVAKEDAEAGDRRICITMNVEFHHK